MAKLYTRAEWEQLMRGLPLGDRTSYEESPDVPQYTVRPTAAPVDERSQLAARGVLTTAAPAATSASQSNEQERLKKLAELEEKTAKEKRMAELKAEREAKMAAEAAARAASDPMLDPTNRPEAVQDEPGFIKYYGWIGGATSGRWKLYKTPVGSPNAASAQERSTGGETQATFSSAVGANTVVSATTTTLTPGTTTTLLPPGTTTTLTPGTTTTLLPPGTTTTTGQPGTTTTVFTTPFTTAPGKTVISTYTDPATGDIYAVYSNGTTTLLSKGTKLAEQTAERRSAFALLRDEFTRYGLADLVGDIENLIVQGVSPAEFAIQLRKSPVYEMRFSGNKARISKGLQALSEAEYISLEDQYQDVMRRYGLPKSYYEPGQYGIQSGFQKLIENDVSSVELEDRIQTAQNRVLFANPEVGIALRTFYPNITNGDVLAYVLDPENALAQIKRRITAAEIGASAVQLGLTTSETDAEYLARYGVTKEQAQAGFRTVAETLPRGRFLGEIYAEQGLGPYTQQTAEREVFNVPGAAEAAAKRRRLAEMETAQFSGQAGMGALARERAGQF